jgi:hypothetical protein
MKIPDYLLSIKSIILGSLLSLCCLLYVGNICKIFVWLIQVKDRKGVGVGVGFGGEGWDWSRGEEKGGNQGKGSSFNTRTEQPRDRMMDGREGG